jgi:uncharacterized repeat protein (TIGR04076 family)
MKNIKRREFCKAVPGAVAGSWVFAGADQEEKMAGKVTSVIAKVKSQKGSCAIGHKLGDEVRFTEEGVDGKICIHALYSMMPAVFAMLFDARFPWLEDPDTKTHACPDAYNPVVFEITRVREM